MALRWVHMPGQGGVFYGYDRRADGEHLVAEVHWYGTSPQEPAYWLAFVGGRLWGRDSYATAREAQTAAEEAHRESPSGMATVKRDGS